MTARERTIARLHGLTVGVILSGTVSFRAATMSACHSGNMEDRETLGNVTTAVAKSEADRLIGLIIDEYQKHLDAERPQEKPAEKPKIAVAAGTNGTHANGNGQKK